MFGMQNGYGIANVFGIFIRKRVITDYQIESEFGMEYVYRTD